MVDLLSSGKGDIPSAQIEGCTLFWGDFADAEVKGEWGPPAGSSPRARDSLQPPAGSLYKGNRRHEGNREPGIEWLNHTADEPHVVVGRQPDHTSTLSRMLQVVLDQ